MGSILASVDEKWYQDPSFLQYAVVAGKAKAVCCLLEQLLRFSVAFESVFNPRGSNTKRDLLTLSVGLPATHIAVLDTLLAFMRAKEHADSVGDLGGWLNLEGPAQTTPLLAAVEVGNWDAAERLVHAGADLLKEPRYRPCPLVVILTKHVDNLTRLKAIEGVKQCLAEAVASPRWDNRAMQIRGGGKTLGTVLSKKDTSWTSEIQTTLREYDPTIGHAGAVQIDHPTSDIQPRPDHSLPRPRRWSSASNARRPTSR
jgi:ankyrin repeat protein